MTILGVIVLFIVVGVVLWLVNRFIPMQAEIKMLMNAVVVIVLVLIVLQETGLLPMLNTPIRAR